MRMRTQGFILFVCAALISSGLLCFPYASAGDKSANKELQKKVEQEIEFRLGLRGQPGGKKVKAGETAVYQIQQPGLGARFRNPSLIDLLSHPEKIFNIVSSGSLSQSAPKADIVLPVGEAVRIRAVRVGKTAESFHLELVTVGSYPTVDDAGNQIVSPALAFVYFDFASELPQENYDAVLNAVFRWIAPQNPDALPSSRPAGPNLTRFEHSRYVVSYPSDWQLQGGPYAQVIIAPKGGIQKNMLWKGVLINAFQQAAGSSTGMDESFRLLLEDLHRRDPHFVAGSIHDVSFGQGLAKATESSDQTTQEHNWLVAVPRQDGSLLYLIFVSRETEYTLMRPVFESILRSLQVPDVLESQSSVTQGRSAADNSQGRAVATQPVVANEQDSEPPVQLRENQTPDEVERALGKPNDITTVSNMIIYTYPSVKVFFENGKLVNVEERKK